MASLIFWAHSQLGVWNFSALALAQYSVFAEELESLSMEGFTVCVEALSLDDESLRQAMNVLIKLSGSNRLVGIISHVTELKDRIDKQIVVTKTPNKGSKIEIIC